jgi:hypothetical protein
MPSMTQHVRNESTGREAKTRNGFARKKRQTMMQSETRLLIMKALVDRTARYYGLLRKLVVKKYFVRKIIRHHFVQKINFYN